MSNAIWEFQRVFPPLCPTPLFVALWERGACSFVPDPHMQLLLIASQFLTCKFLKSPWISKSTVWKSLTHREEGGHLRVEEFYFCFRFFASLWSGFSGMVPHSQRPQHWCIWPVTLKESDEAFFQGILALPHFTKHTVNSLPLPPSLSNPRGHREPLPHIKFISSLSHSDLLVTSLQGSLF